VEQRKLPLKVAGSTGFHSCINQTLSSSHTVEEEFLIDIKDFVVATGTYTTPSVVRCKELMNENFIIGNTAVFLRKLKKIKKFFRDADTQVIYI
jgi:hypothetical protein